MAKRGRPTKFTNEIAAEICLRLANGEPLCTICEDEHMPTRHTVLYWALRREGFSTDYARAREVQAEVYADEIVSLANNSRIGQKTEKTIGPDGKPTSKIITADMVERTRLQIDARKWYTSHVMPRKWGDRQSVEHSGPDGGPLAVTVNLRFPSGE